MASARHCSYLGNNHFSGTIPAQLKDANDLAEIYFEYNEITGTIPAELGELGNLRWVYGIIVIVIVMITLDSVRFGTHARYNSDISHNQLEGTIPKELHGWSLLYDLYVARSLACFGAPLAAGADSHISP